MIIIARITTTAAESTESFVPTSGAMLFRPDRLAGAAEVPAIDA